MDELICFHPERSNHKVNAFIQILHLLISGNCNNEYDDVTLFSDAAKTAIKKALDTGSKVGFFFVFLHRENEFLCLNFTKKSIYFLLFYDTIILGPIIMFLSGKHRIPRS